MDSPDRASNNQPVLEGVASETDAPLEEGIPAGGPFNVEKIGEGAPLGVAAAPILPPRPADTESSRKRPLTRCY